MSHLPGASSWSEYMSTEGWKWYGYDEIAVLDLPDSEKAQARDHINTLANPGEMWDFIAGLKANLLVDMQRGEH